MIKCKQILLATQVVNCVLILRLKHVRELIANKNVSGNSIVIENSLNQTMHPNTYVAKKQRFKEI
jgi:hypothetical protein